MPGPMAAWARSTGAMLPVCSRRTACGSSDRRAARKIRRVVGGALVERRRQTRTMLEARALVPLAMILPEPSVRIGNVPVIENPERITASRNVSQPVLEIPFFPLRSDCLKA